MSNEAKIKKIQDMAIKMRRKAIDMAYLAGKNGAHLGAGLSSIEILACLYGGIMDIDSSAPTREDRDYFIPSKAHCVLAFYPALAYAGYFPMEDLEQFEKNGSPLPGHPIKNVNRGIEFSGGSLGMGLSLGVGLALALKAKKSSNRVYVLIGDGECDEGAIWEAAMSAKHFGLDNLTVIVDQNKLQYDGSTEEIMSLSCLEDKFQSFGFRAITVDGHNVEKLYEAFLSAKEIVPGKPTVIIADTIKGKGISFMENKKEWHHGVLTKELYEQAVRELEGCGDDI